MWFPSVWLQIKKEKGRGPGGCPTFNTKEEEPAKKEDCVRTTGEVGRTFL